MQASARISARRSGPIEISGKVGELTQQESKMSSECSSDETVIYVMKPAENEQMARKRSKTDDEEHAVHDLDDDLNDDDSQERGAGLEIGDARKVLPKIYSAVNSVSSQDSGINLSFHESDKSLDSMDLKRSSSAESNSTNSYGRKPRTCSMTALPSNKSNSCNRQQAVRQNDDFSEDEECSSNDLKEEEDGGNGDAASSFGAKGDGDGKVEACRPQWHCPPKNIWKPAVEAMQEFDMIRDNDRVLVCLSTNCKSSLSLLHALHQYRFYVRSKGVDFEIGAATVDPSGSNPVELAGYLESLNVPYFHEEQEEEEEEGKRGDNRGLEEGVDASGACSFCDRGTRARLYAIAKRHGYNVLAVGQHLDDLTEGFLVSVFHGGKLRTMKAHYYVRRQDLRVVRPFVYVREKALRQFVESKKLLVSRGIDLPEVSIPSSSSSQILFIYISTSSLIDVPPSILLQKQKRSKELILQQQERAYPRLYWSLRTALRPLIDAHEQQIDPDLVSPVVNTPGSSSSGSSSGCCSLAVSNNGGGQQKRQQRTRAKANSISSVTSGQWQAAGEQDENEETDEEPVL